MPYRAQPSRFPSKNKSRPQLRERGYKITGLENATGQRWFLKDDTTSHFLNGWAWLKLKTLNCISWIKKNFGKNFVTSNEIVWPGSGHKKVYFKHLKSIFRIYFLNFKKLIKIIFFILIKFNHILNLFNHYIIIALIYFGRRLKKIFLDIGIRSYE